MSQVEIYAAMICSFASGFWAHFMLCAFRDVTQRRKEEKCRKILESHDCHVDLVQYDSRGRLKKEELI